MLKHPFFILQLSDFHFKSDLDYKDILDKIKERITIFLRSKNRNSVDLMIVTGDMMDRNGKGTHRKAAEAINNLKDAIAGKNTRLYCCPGNHDLNFDDALDVLNVENRVHCFDNYKPSYELVDSNYEGLSSAFEAYKEFCTKIDATNKPTSNNTLNHLYGYDFINYGNSQILVNWFNSSWLSVANKKWEKLATKIYESRKTDFQKKQQVNSKVPLIKAYGDDKMISVGSEINELTYNKMDEVLNMTSPTKFVLSFLHHFPRNLNWFDIYRVKSIDKPSFYERISKSDMILSGHTHGNLLDGKFATPPGLDTPERKHISSEVILYEVDLINRLWIKHRLEIETPGKKTEVVFYSDEKDFQKLKRKLITQDLDKRYELNNFSKRNEKHIDYGHFSRLNF